MMWNIAIKAGGRQVVAHGSIIVGIGEEILLEISPTLQVRIKFFSEPRSEAKINTRGLGPVIEVDLINMAGLGDSNTVSIEIGTSGKQKIVMNVICFGSGEAPLGKRALHYTISLEG